MKTKLKLGDLVKVVATEDKFKDWIGRILMVTTVNKCRKNEHFVKKGEPYKGDLINTTPQPTPDKGKCFHWMPFMLERLDKDHAPWSRPQ